MRILLASLVIICGLNLFVEANVISRREYWPAYDDDDLFQLTDLYENGDSADYLKFFAELYDKKDVETSKTVIVPEHDDNKKNAHADNFHEDDSAARVNGDDDNDDNDTNDSKDSSDNDNGKDGNDEQVKNIEDYEFEKEEMDKLMQSIVDELHINDSESTKTNAGDEHDSDESDTNDTTNSNDDLTVLDHTLSEEINELEDIYTKQWQELFKDDNETESTENNDAQNIDDIDANDGIANNENNNEKPDIDGNVNANTVYNYVTFKFKNDDDNSIEQNNEDNTLSLQFVAMNDGKQKTWPDQEDKHMAPQYHSNRFFEPNYNEYQNTNQNDKDSYEIINTKGQPKVWGFKPLVFSDYENHAEIFKTEEPQNILGKQISNNVVDFIKIRDDLTTLTNNLMQKEESLTNDFLRATDDDQGLDMKRYEDDVTAISSILDELQQRVVGLQNMLPKLYANNLLKNVLEKVTMEK